MAQDQAIDPWATWIGPSSYAARMAVLGELPRTQAIDTIEAWYNGCAYSVGLYARPYAWDQETDPTTNQRIPLENRRPYQVNIAKQIVNTSVGMLFGEGHFPGIEAEDDEDTENWIAVLAEAVRLEAEMMRAAKMGGRARSVAVVFKVIEGYPRLELLPAKYCLPTFGPDGESLTFLRYQYKAGGDHFNELGYTLDPSKDYWYRAEYTPVAELHYQPVEVAQDGSAPVFVKDDTRSVEHGLNILAAVWMKNLPSDHPFDGEATYESVIELLHQVNVQFSKALRSIGKMADPTVGYENIQDPDDIPAGQKVGSSSGGSLVSPGGLKILEVSGSGQDAAGKWVDRLTQAIAQITRVIDHEPEQIKGGALSGYALRILHGPLLELVGELRLMYGPSLIRLIRLMLQVLTKLPMGSVFLPREVKGVPNPKAVLSLKWGDPFPPTSDDIKSESETLLALVAGRLLSAETALARICYLYNVEDVDGERQRIESERGQDPEHSLQTAIDQLNQGTGLNDAGRPDNHPPEGAA